MKIDIKEVLHQVNVLNRILEENSLGECHISQNRLMVIGDNVQIALACCDRRKKDR